MTVVVVGTSGCGKSTVIRKGLKKFALSEPIACRSISGIPGLTSVTNCKYISVQVCDYLEIIVVQIYGVLVVLDSLKTSSIVR